MKELRKEFAEEIKSLLSNYVNDNELSSFISKFETKNTVSGGSAELIKNFYAQQLKIEYSFGKDRMQIDRTITFAKKNLSKVKYLNLLKELAQLCIANGKLSFAFEILNKLQKESDDDNDKAEAFLALSDAFGRKADWAHSIEALKKADNLYIKTGNDKGRAKCQNMLGVIYGEKGNLPEAREHFEKCLELINKSDEKELTASVESNLAIILSIQGEKDQAIKYYEKALRYFESAKNYRRIAEMRQNIGMLFMDKNEHGAALKEFDVSIEIALEHKLMPVLSAAYLSKANLLISIEDYDGADAFANQALEISHLIDDKLSIADVYRIKSIVERKKKNYSQAENYLQSSLRLNAKGSNRLNEAEAKLELADLYGDMNRTSEKERLLNESLREFQDLNITDRVKKIEDMLTAASVK